MKEQGRAESDESTHKSGSAFDMTLKTWQGCPPPSSFTVLSQAWKWGAFNARKLREGGGWLMFVYHVYRTEAVF